MPTTVSYGSWTTHGDALCATIENTIRDALADFAPQFDIDGIATEFRAALNTALPDGVTLDGNEFHGPDIPGDRPNLRAIIRTVDMFAIAARNEQTGASAL